MKRKQLERRNQVFSEIWVLLLFLSQIYPSKQQLLLSFHQLKILLLKRKKRRKRIRLQASRQLLLQMIKQNSRRLLKPIKLRKSQPLQPPLVQINLLNKKQIQLLQLSHLKIPCLMNDLISFLRNGMAKSREMRRSIKSRLMIYSKKRLFFSGPLIKSRQ